MTRTLPSQKLYILFLRLLTLLYLLDLSPLTKDRSALRKSVGDLVGPEIEDSELRKQDFSSVFYSTTMYDDYYSLVSYLRLRMETDYVREVSGLKLSRRETSRARQSLVISLTFFLKTTLLIKILPIDCHSATTTYLGYYHPPQTRRREGFDSETRLLTHLDNRSRSLRLPQVRRFLFLLSYFTDISSYYIY